MQRGECFYSLRSNREINHLLFFAVKEKLEIVASLCEAKTAKEPGRTKFAEMLKQIEQGKADGILSWHPDRLARNAVDGGRIIHLIDKGIIKSLKFPTFWFEPTPQGLFMLQITLYKEIRNYFKSQRWRGKRPPPACRAIFSLGRFAVSKKVGSKGQNLS